MTEKRFATSADDIFAIDDLDKDEVYVPQWDRWLMVRALTASERDAFEASIMEGKGKDRDVNFKNLRAKLVAKAVIDPDGNSLFSEKDVSKLGGKNAAALNVVFEAAQRLSGLKSEDVEELAGNSDSGQSDEPISVGRSHKAAQSESS